MYQFEVQAEVATMEMEGLVKGMWCTGLGISFQFEPSSRCRGTVIPRISSSFKLRVK